MIQDAELNAETDKKQRELIDQRNQVEGLVNEIEKDLKDYGDKITEEEKTKLTEAIANLKKAAADGDVPDIQKCMPLVYEAYNTLTKAKSDAEEAAKKAAESAPADGPVDVESKEVKPDAQ